MIFFFLFYQNTNEARWVDGGKEVFHLNLQLVSSIYTSHHHLHNFFHACDRFHSGSISQSDVTRHVKVGCCNIKKLDFD